MPELFQGGVMTSKQMERWHDAWLTVPLTPQIFGAANGYCESIIAYSDENRRVLPQPSEDSVPWFVAPETMHDGDRCACGVFPPRLIDM